MRRKYWPLSELKRRDSTIFTSSTKRSVLNDRKTSQTKATTLQKINTQEIAPRITLNREKTTWGSIIQESRILKNLQETKKSKGFSIHQKFKMKNIRKISSRLNFTVHQGYSLPWKTMIDDVWACSYKGQRGYNEDRILVSSCIKYNEDNEGSLFAVFDGHGGDTVAEYLKENFTKSFLNFCKQNQTPELALKNALLQMQQYVINNKMSSGSCALICFITEQNYYIANVGDSRALLINNEQDYRQITKDHKPNHPAQRSRIQKNGGQVYRTCIQTQDGTNIYGPFRVHPGKLSVSRTIGDFPIKKSLNNKIISSEPEIYVGTLKPKQTLLLFTDGAYEKFSNQELSILLSFSSSNYKSNTLPINQSLQLKTKNFIEQCKKRQTNDNVSIIAIKIANSLSKKHSLDSITCPSL